MASEVILEKRMADETKTTEKKRKKKEKKKVLEWKVLENIQLSEFEDDKKFGPENFKIVALLGVGSQGRVYLVNLIGTELYYAMKVFKKVDILTNQKVKLIFKIFTQNYSNIQIIK